MNKKLKRLLIAGAVSLGSLAPIAAPAVLPSTVMAATSLNVTFNGNGGLKGTAGTYTQKFTQGTAQALTANAFTKKGYTFTNWNTKKDGKGTFYKNKAKSTFNKATTLYAQWKANNYSVVFNGNASTKGTMKEQTHTYDTAKALTKNAFEKTGYIFSSWNTKKDGKGTAYKNAASVKNLTATNGGKVNLFAQWTAKTSNVKFHINILNNTKTYSEKYTYGAKNQSFGMKLTKKTGQFGTWNKTGYTLLGWSADSKAKKATYAVYSGIKDTWIDKNYGNKNLYAVWSPNTYSVVFNANKGTGSIPTQTGLKYDTKTKLTANNKKITRTGYKFNGWNTKADGKGTKVADGAQVLNLTSAKNGKVTLYAQWKANTYKVTFKDGYSGKVLNTQSVEYGKAAKAPANPTRTGYIFNGWKGTYNKITGNTTIEAKWAYQPWVKKNGKYYYYTKESKLLKGWQQLGKGAQNPDGTSKKHWSFFDLKTGELYTGWHTMGKAEGEKTVHTSYFGKDGWLQTGWKHFDKADGEKTPHWSYFGDNGWLRTGWQQMGKGTNNAYGENTTPHWSYFGNNGWLRTGLQTMGTANNPDSKSKKHRSHFGSNGWLVTRNVASGIFFDANGWEKTYVAPEDSAKFNKNDATESISWAIKMAGQSNKNVKLANTYTIKKTVGVRTNNIKFNGGGTIKFSEADGNIFYVHATGIEFNKIHFEGNYNKKYLQGVSVAEGNRAGVCILFHTEKGDAKTGKWVFNAKVLNCTFRYTKKRGISIGAYGCQQENSVNTNRGSAGYAPNGKTNTGNIARPSNIEINNCNFYRLSGIALCTAGGRNLTIKNNEFRDSGFEHITLDWGTRDSSVTGNKFYGTTGGCGVIGADTAYNCTIDKSNTFATTKQAAYVKFNDLNGITKNMHVSGVGVTRNPSPYAGIKNVYFRN